MRFIFLLFIFTGFIHAQIMGPFLRSEASKPLLKSSGTDYHLTVQGEDGFVKELKKAGFSVQTSKGMFATVMVPRNRLQELAAIKGIQKIELGPKRKLYNSNAVNYQNVDVAYAKGYTGKSVIIGIVDTGIDFYNPMFLDTNGNTRILSIWDQTVSGSGPSETKFSYGVEYSQIQIDQDIDSGSPHSVVPQRDTEGHGTHVAGSAAGRHLTVSPADTLHGGAMAANLIIVKTTLMGAAIVDGVEYIFNKAAALGKPCVVNLSLGSQYGPHDGSDANSQFIDGYTEAGKIVVRAAGNNGGDPLHYFKTSKVTSESIQFKYASLVNMWLEAGDKITSVSLSWSGGSISNVTKGTSKEYSGGGITLYLDNKDPMNNKMAAYVVMDNEDLESKSFTLTLNGLSDDNENGTIERHLWSEDSVSVPFGAFTQGSEYSGSHYPFTLANGACAPKVITVGAFISRESWTAINNNPGQAWHIPGAGAAGGIADFSSIGPTATGAQKPDIIAGGTMILSARSSDAIYSDYYIPKSPYTDDFAYMQGTSMASPVAAGAIALLLEKNPSWTPADMMVYLKSNAQGTSNPQGLSSSEVNVKTDPNNWDRVFGWGAIDVTAAFGPEAIDDADVTIPDGFVLEQNYPNPFNPSTAISYRLSVISEVRLTVYNALGQKVRTLVNRKQQAGPHTVTFNASGLASGVYYYKLSAGNETVQARKMLLLR